MNLFERRLTLWVAPCIVANPLTILWIAIPPTFQTLFIFAITYAGSKLLHFSYEDAAASAMIGASNHFEGAIATAAGSPLEENFIGRSSCYHAGPAGFRRVSA